MRQEICDLHWMVIEILLKEKIMTKRSLVSTSMGHEPFGDAMENIGRTNEANRAVVCIDHPSTVVTLMRKQKEVGKKKQKEKQLTLCAKMSTHSPNVDDSFTVHGESACLNFVWKFLGTTFQRANLGLILLQILQNRFGELG